MKLPKWKEILFHKKKLRKEKKTYRLPVIFCLFLLVLLWFLPTGYEGAEIYQGTERCKAKVTKVYNDNIRDTGLVRSGEQICELLILDGKFDGRTAEGVNQLKGSLESDTIYTVGEEAFVVIEFKGEEINFVTMIDHYRLNQEGILVLLFAGFLILFAGKSGIRAILSFGITILMIWKVLVPLYLKGVPPILTGLCITIVLTVLIISLVYGLDQRLFAAALGAVFGVGTTCVVGLLFTKSFQIHGAVMAYSESLLYSGYQHLNLTQIFMAGIFIGSSGAMMDLAVDITSAVYEVVRQCPGITKAQAVRSGMNVGRAAMGTMTTTLLLAYSGGYIALLMVFMAQGTPIDNILNYKYVAAELLDTMIGSFGLVTVAPFTALTAGLILAGSKNASDISDIQISEQNNP